MLNSRKNSIKILKIAGVHAVTVANEDILENVFFIRESLRIKIIKVIMFN